MQPPSAKTIIIGSLNTDLIVSGAGKLLKAGEMTRADDFTIAPGGKSRNIAAMTAVLNDTGKNIYFIGKTIRDKFGFWKYPYFSLKELGVNMKFTKVLSKHPKYKIPGLAIIPIDKMGRNQIYLVPGVRNDFSPKDIIEAETLFNKVGKENGYLVITLEMPAETAEKVLSLSKRYGIRTLIDAGGVEGRPELVNVIKKGGFLLKPNEYETEAITGVKVKDFKSAEKAAVKILSFGFEYVLITHGKFGAYLFGKVLKKHLKAPKFDITKGDSLGCGDQTMAGVLFGLVHGKDIEESSRIGVAAGTLQHTKQGIIPVQRKELNRHLR